MRYILYLYLLISIVACKGSHQQTSVIDTYKYTNHDSIYIRDHLYTQHTPNNNTVKYKIFNGYYRIHWVHKGIEKVYPDSFKVSDWYHRNFKVIAENENYLLLKAGCGNPCNVCYLLPLNNTPPIAIHDYIYSDLQRHYIVYVADVSKIGVLNIISNNVDTATISKCESYPAICIDSLYFKGDTLYYSQSGNWEKVKLKN